MKSLKRIVSIAAAVVLLFGVVQPSMPVAEAKTSPQGQTVGSVLFYLENMSGDQILVSQLSVRQMEKDMENGLIDGTVYNYSVLDRYVTTVHQEASGFTLPQLVTYAQNKSSESAIRNLSLTYEGEDELRFREMDQSGYDDMDTYTYDGICGTTRYNFPQLYHYWNYTTQDYYDPTGAMTRSEALDYIYKNGEPTAPLLSVRAYSQRYMLTGDKYGVDYNMENCWESSGLLDNERALRLMLPMTKADLYDKTPTASDSRYWISDILLKMADSPEITPLGKVEAPTAVMTEDDDNYYIRFSCKTDGATVYYNQNFISPSYTPTCAYTGKAVVVPKTYFPSGTVTMTLRAVKDGYTDAGVKTLKLTSSGKEDAVAQLTDVSGSAWYYDAVNCVLKNELFDTNGNNAFSPDEPMTRAMLVTALYRLRGSPVVTGTTQFTDVSSTEDCFDAVSWAHSKGVVSGKSDTEFDPDGSVTREQFATMLHRYAMLEGYSTAASGDISSFSDSASVSSYAAEALSWAVGEELINGMGDGTISPQGNATRAQAAQVIMKFIEADK